MPKSAPTIGELIDKGEIEAALGTIVMVGESRRAMDALAAILDRSPREEVGGMIALLERMGRSVASALLTCRSALARMDGKSRDLN